MLHCEGSHGAFGIVGVLPKPTMSWSRGDRSLWALGSWGFGYLGLEGCEGLRSRFVYLVGRREVRDLIGA